VGSLCGDSGADSLGSLYATTSRPFLRPASGRIAVKAVNYFGDEVLKVINV
jgi:adenine-specific DNA-methyltransferase